jgi:hypothetical protein
MLMHHFDERAQLERVAAWESIGLTQGSRAYKAWMEVGEDRTVDGQHAGTVLALWYALNKAPWKLPDPPKGGRSATLAIHCAAALGAETAAWRGTEAGKAYIARHRAQGLTVPAGYAKSGIDRCWREMRPVAHLWGAVQLHRFQFMGVGSCPKGQFLPRHAVLWDDNSSWHETFGTMPGALIKGAWDSLHSRWRQVDTWEDDVRTFRGKRNLRAILATARTLQQFAAALMPTDWLVPEHIGALEPDWPQEPPAWQELRRDWLARAIQEAEHPEQTARKMEALGKPRKARGSRQVKKSRKPRRGRRSAKGDGST